jgi:putative transposase
MPNFRRLRDPGGRFFFTVVSDGRAPLLCQPPAPLLLREVVCETRDRWPFELHAMVVLPDHLHAIWTMPEGDSDYSKRWAWLKKEFTKRWLLNGGAERVLSRGRIRDGRRGVWQPKFWEHAIRDERDFDRYVEYIHFNPVHHGVAKCPHAWRLSTFDRWVREQSYPADWACSCDPQVDVRLDFKAISSSVGE